MEFKQLNCFTLRCSFDSFSEQVEFFPRTLGLPRMSSCGEEILRAVSPFKDDISWLPWLTAANFLASRLQLQGGKVWGGKCYAC